MKKLKHFVNWAIWSLITVYALLMVVTHVPSCQRWIGNGVASVIGKQLGTEVSIERVDVGFLNRLIVDGLLVKDQEHRNMLEVGRMSVKLELLPLSEGKVVISSAQLFNAHAMLQRKDSLSQCNFQFVVDSLSSKDSTTSAGPNLVINSLIVRRSSVSFDQHDVEPTPGIINPSHLSVSDISAHIILKYLTSDSLMVNVKRLAFSEQAGLAVKRLSFQLMKNPTGARLSDFFLQLPRSSMTIDSLVATCDFDRLKETLAFTGDLTDCSITPSDLSFISPKVKMLKTPLNVKATVSGSGYGIDVKKLIVFSIDGSFAASASGWWKKLGKQPQWLADINQLSAREDFIALLAGTLSDAPAIVKQLTAVQLSGRAGRNGEGITMINGQATTNLGKLRINAQADSHRHYNGHIDSEDIELGSIAENADLGQLSAQLDFSGDDEEIGAKGTIAKLDFRGYTYNDIKIDGSYLINNKLVNGRLQIDDSQLKASIEGAVEHGTTSVVRLTGDIARLNPKALMLSNQWGNATFSGVIDADFTATGLNDMNGSIAVSRFAMRDSTTNYYIDHLQLRSGIDNGQRILTFDGDMGTGELKGRFDLTTITHSFLGFVSKQLPTLPALPPQDTATDNVFEGLLFLKDSRWMKHLLGVDLELKAPLQLQASVDDRNHQMSLTGDFPRFIYNHGIYEKGHLNITSPNDTIRCEASLVRLSGDQQHRTDFGVKAMAADNGLSITFLWDNNRAEERVSGQLNANATFYRNDHGKPETFVSILPSFVVMGDQTWDVEPGNIIYNDDRITVDHLSVVHNQQHIIADGVASKSENDSLCVDLKGVEVAYILDLVGFTAVSFAGEATGKAFVTQALNTPKAWADLSVEHFMFEGGRMGTLSAHAQWNQQEKQIDINAVADDGPDAKTLIDGFVSPTHEKIDLAIRGRGTYIDFLQTYTKSFLSGVTGHATGNLRLVGPLGEMDLLGQLLVDAQATVTALGTTYTLSQDTVTLVHDDILLHNAEVKDIYQNTAWLSGGIHHENLSNLTFDLNVNTEKLLAYDMKDKSGELFYGTVMASGNVDIIGRPGEVTINCNATPLAGSIFTYNAATPDAINDQRFISWSERKPYSTQVNASDNAPAAEPQPYDNDHEAQRPVAHSSMPTSTDLRINFLLNTNPEATLRLLMDAKTEDYITLAGQGVIRAAYHDKGAFQMFGTYTVDHGTYGITIQNIIKKNFTFQPGGTIVFGGAPFDAALNLQALYTVNGVSLSDLSIGNSFTNNTVRVNCLMNIGGQAGAPQVEFDLDMPTVNSEEKQMIRSVITSEQEMNQQVLYLLGIGRFYTQGTNNAGSQQQYGQSQLAMQSFLSGTLSTQINEVLSQVLKANNWNFGANISTGNEGWHNAEYEGIVSGRMLNNRLLIDGQFGYRDNATQATPSFIGDFNIRYLLHPNGNLALKVYNQTNDRYFTRSSLNTQGIGFILKRDFNRLGDLFHSRRKTKTAASTQRGR